MGVGDGGRAWGPLLGETEEVNDLSRQLRMWLDDAGLTLDQLAARLTPDHFDGRRPPARSAISARLAGRHLDLSFAEAVVDVCSDRHDIAAPRLDHVRRLWRFAAQAGTPSAPPGSSPLELLVDSQQQTIAVHEQLARALEARAKSEQARADSEKLVIVLLQMVQQLTARISRLRSQEGLLHRHEAEAELKQIRIRLSESESLLEQALVEKAQAESQWQEALEVAEQGQRRVEFLERELRDLRGDPVAVPAEPDPGRPMPTLPDPGGSADSEFVADITETLSKIHDVNDRSQALTTEARDELAELELTTEYADDAGAKPPSTRAEHPAPVTSASERESGPLLAPTGNQPRAGRSRYAVRIAVTTFVATLVVVVLVAVPLAVTMVRSIDQSGQSTADNAAARISDYVQVVLGSSQPALSDHLASLDAMLPSDSFARIAVPGQAPLLLHRDPGPEPAFRSRQDAGQVTVSVPRAAANARIRRTVALIAGGSVVVLSLVTGLAYLMARRLTTRLADLATTAERMQPGHPHPRYRRYGISELDRVAEAIDNSVEALALRAETERRMAVDASNGLRTPLAALSMRMEEILYLADNPQTVREQAEVALAQVERLTDVVQRMLSTNRSVDQRTRDLSVPIEVDTLIRQQIHEWRPAYQSLRRGIVVSGERRLMVLSTPGVLSQILSTLLENALIHGDGTVTVHTRGLNGSMIMEVGDEGEGIATDAATSLFDRTSGAIGLAVARELAEAEGGRLLLVLQRPAVFAVSLPLHSPSSKR